MRRAEHGGVPWYLLFTLVAAGAAGVGTYVVLHERELAKAKEAALEAAKPKPPTPVPTRVAPPGDPLAAGTVTVQSPYVTSGDLDALSAEIRISALKPELERCYQGVSASGELRMQVMIDADGKARAARALEAFDETLASCVGKALRRINYPRTVDGANAVITVPITFTR